MTLPIYQPAVMARRFQIEEIIRTSGIDKSSRRVEIARTKLGNLERVTPPPAQQVVQLAIYLLKKRFLSTTGALPDDRDDHYLTDHAFVRALFRVYDLDIKAMKDMVMDEIAKRSGEFTIVQANGKALTVLKNGS